MSAKLIRYFFLCCMTILPMGVGAQPAESTLVYERALYPNGPPRLHNEMTDVKERAEFVLVTEAALPGMHRRIAVYAERLDNELPLDKIYRVYVAVFEEQGDALRLVDRHDVTEEMRLFVDFPGNFLDLDALVTPIVTHDPPLVAVELWERISGTGFYTQADHLFFSMNPKGILEPLLTLPMTYASGRSRTQKDARITDLYLSTGPDPELIVSRRSIHWEDYEADSAPECSPASLSRYRLDGAQNEPVEAPGAVPRAGFVLLPRVDAEEKPTCGE
jgi:hypothetical protein